jgi:hypothetical protein
LIGKLDNTLQICSFPSLRRFFGSGFSGFFKDFDGFSRGSEVCHGLDDLVFLDSGFVLIVS